MVEIFARGSRVRCNYYTDRRASGWEYGTVLDGPVQDSDWIAYLIKHETYESWMNAKLLELANGDV